MAQGGQDRGSALGNALRHIPLIGGVLGGVGDVLSGVGNIAMGNVGPGFSEIRSGIYNSIAAVNLIGNAAVRKRQ